jgi:hypothetical protein
VHPWSFLLTRICPPFPLPRRIVQHESRRSRSRRSYKPRFWVVDPGSLVFQRIHSSCPYCLAVVTTRLSQLEPALQGFTRPQPREQPVTTGLTLHLNFLSLPQSIFFFSPISPFCELRKVKLGIEKSISWLPASIGSELDSYFWQTCL